ncbi:hypothetical protein K438DRAFT_2093776 [Mycena galopus ATCC 62051]|nr:hypothetical protein K438DRAFT_2093776 [Mycena galopus ATCC 62051]
MSPLDESPLGACDTLSELFETPKSMRVLTDATFDPIESIFSGGLGKWGPPSPNELLGSPLALPLWDVDGAEPIEFQATQSASTRPEPPTSTNTDPSANSPLVPRGARPVARVDPTVFEDAPLGSDDDYDYALEDAEEHEREEMKNLLPLTLQRHAVDFATASTFGSLGAPSPPLSSEAPSPESTRDFDFNDGASEFSRRSESPPRQDVEPHPENDVFDGDDADEWQTFGAELAENVASDESASESEEDEPLISHAPAFAQPLPRPIIALPARRLATQATVPPVAGSSKFFHTADDSDSEDDASYSGDDDSDYGHSARRAAPTKRRRTNSSKAVPVPLPKRDVKGKGKGKATGKAKAPAKPKRSPEPKILAGFNEVIEFVCNKDGTYRCPLIEKGCTHIKLYESLSGVDRHFKLKHLPLERLDCLAGCGATFARRDVYRKHLKGEGGSGGTCKAAKAEVDKAIQQLDSRVTKTKTKAPKRKRRGHLDRWFGGESSQTIFGVERRENLASKRTNQKPKIQLQLRLNCASLITCAKRVASVRTARPNMHIGGREQEELEEDVQATFHGIRWNRTVWMTGVNRTTACLSWTPSNFTAAQVGRSLAAYRLYCDSSAEQSFVFTAEDPWLHNGKTKGIVLVRESQEIGELPLFSPSATHVSIVHIDWYARKLFERGRPFCQYAGDYALIQFLNSVSCIPFPIPNAGRKFSHRWSPD